MKECSKDRFWFKINDPYLLPHAGVLEKRHRFMGEMEGKLTRNFRRSLASFAVYHEVLGLHFNGREWLFREWAPNALAIFLVGEMSSWRISQAFALHPSRGDARGCGRGNGNGEANGQAKAQMDGTGIWEGRFPRETFCHGALFRLHILWEGGEGERIPTAARRVVQDPDTGIFNAQVWEPPEPFIWKNRAVASPSREVPVTSGEHREAGHGGALFIYEAHVGMAQEEGGVGTWLEFARNILPRIKGAGYNAIQLMGVMEHPYYASFGYHVTSFYAPSSRFGTPEEFKELVDQAHAMGLLVFMDLIHSHSAMNEVEGISRFDGTPDQFFYPGDRGYHRLWDSRCFDYGKIMVLRFLLSNCRYWMEEFSLDGFRFDGVTSMIFKDHGLNRAFTNYGDYFGEGVDINALAYLGLANRLIHQINPGAVTIAEDVSGYPGMASLLKVGGLGFDYRFAMGIPDFWIRLLKEYRDEDWPLETLWHELNSRRYHEKTISYAESHDQALVGDQTLMMHLMGGRIYTAMSGEGKGPVTFRGVALHKMIRLVTLATAGAGYLNFMGNEFGHPEWIDFPRKENNWSFHHARRQWSLADNPDLVYSGLARFDGEMIDLFRSHGLPDQKTARLIHLHGEDKVLAFERGGLIFVFNFNPMVSFEHYGFELLQPGHYRMIFDTDSPRFGGEGRLAEDQVHFTLPVFQEEREVDMISLYLPSRAALVLGKR